MWCNILLSTYNLPPNDGVLRDNQCSQEFKFFFKAQYQPIFWIGETRYGECGETQLLQIAPLSNSTTFTETSLEVEKFGDWAWVEQGKRVIKREKHIEMEYTGREFRLEEVGFVVKTPELTPHLELERKNFFANACANIWNKNKGEKGIVIPICKGFSPKLLYAYQQGLYYNYQIDRVFIFPDTKYLLVFTKSAAACDTKQTMHGFMLFSFNPS
jgi:hypothetical protein